MPAIFISHSSLDAKIADEIKSTLAKLGFERVFLDFDKETGIGAGENWEKRLYEELSRCHAVILALTPNWMASKWCFAELQQARALGKVIFPIVCEPLGDGKVLTEIQAVDLLDWKAGGLERLEQRLQSISNELARGFALDPNRSPYPGIHAFEAEDAAIYFGRDQETRAVIEKLDARRRQGGARFVIIIGASGSGKSSLLKAGVLPQLARRKSQWIALPTIRPEKAPLEALAKTIADKCGNPHGWREWHAKLKGPDAVREFADLLKDLRVGESKGATLLLPVDQFEEVFTIGEAEERAAFLSLLAAILDPARDLPVLTVATGRADVLQGLLEGSEIAQLVETIQLGKMPLDRVPRLIEGPAAVASILIERGLSERIAQDVESSEALPLLAYTLRVLYERGGGDKRLTNAEYLALGDAARGLNPVQNSVRLAADQAIEGLRPTEQELAALRDTFVPHLVRLRIDDSKRVRQPASLSALPREAERLVRALTEARLLTVRAEDDSAAKPGGDAVIEVTHEALFDAWPMLAGWLNQEQAFLADIERIKTAHQTWLQTPEEAKEKARLHGLLLNRSRDWLVKYPQRFIGRDMEPLRAFIAVSATAEDADQARAARLRRRFVQAVAAAAVVFAFATAISGWLYSEAEQARTTAEEARTAAEQARTTAVTERDRAERSFSIAKQAADDVVFKLALDLRNTGGMRIESIRKILDTAQALLDKLAQAAPDDLQLQRSRYAMFSAFVDTYLVAGDVPRAAQAADQGLAIMRRLIVADPTAWQRDLIVALNKVGDVKLAQGDRPAAFKVYEEGLQIARDLVAADPTRSDSQRDLYIGCLKIGDVYYAAGERTQALKSYMEGLAVIRKLATSNPANGTWQRDLSVNLNKVGDVHMASSHRAQALEVYEEALAIVRGLARSNPTNVELQRDVSVSLNRVGDARLAEGDRAKALAAYDEALVIVRRLAAADPDNAIWQRDVSASLVRIGDAKLANGDRTGALAAYEESLVIVRRLGAADPNNPTWQRDVYISLIKIGDIRSAQGNRAGALAALEEGLVIVRRFAALDPQNNMWQRDLYVILIRIGDIRIAQGDRAGALTAFNECLAIARKLAELDPSDPAWQRDLYVILVRIGDIRVAEANRTAGLAAYEEGLAIMRRLITIDPQNRGWQRDVSLSLNKIGDVRLAEGNHAAALAAFEEGLALVRKLVVADPTNLGWQQDVSVSLNKIGEARQAQGDKPAARAAFAESLGLMRKLIAADQDNANYRIDIIYVLWKVALLSEPPQARTLLVEALAIHQQLAREGKLTDVQKSWAGAIEAEIAKLPAT